MVGKDQGALGAPSLSADASAQAPMARPVQGAPGHKASPRSSSRQRILVVVGWLAVLLAVAGSWQIAATHGLIDPVFTGKPSRKARAKV